MNSQIANIIRSYIEPLAFADRVAGVVRAVSFIQTDGEKQVKKIIPIDCGVTQQDCLKGRYTDLVPNSKYKSIMYFEDGGISVIQRQNCADYHFLSKLKLVVWLNLKKLGKDDCNVSALEMATILNAIPTKSFNNGMFTRIQAKVVSQDIKSAAIFSKYTYTEEKLQYLLYPFDYFALNIETGVSIPKTCIDAWANAPEIICEDNKT